MRDIEWRKWWAWYPVFTRKGEFAWLCWVETRKWWAGPRTAATGDIDLMRWQYRKIVEEK